MTASVEREGKMSSSAKYRSEKSGSCQRGAVRQTLDGIFRGDRKTTAGINEHLQNLVSIKLIVGVGAAQIWTLSCYFAAIPFFP